jgi:hypothetical protein
MSIANLGQLKTTALAYLKRSSLSQMDEVVSLADELIRYGQGDDQLDPLYVPACRADCMLQRGYGITISVNTPNANLPEGFLEFSSPPYIMLPTGEKYPLKLESNRVIYDRASTAPSRPKLFAIEGASLIFPNPSDANYALYGDLFTLSVLDDSAESNLLLSTHPSVYLMAVCYKAQQYIRNVNDEARFFASYKAAVGAANRYRLQKKSAGQTIRPRVSGGTP